MVFIKNIKNKERVVYCVVYCIQLYTVLCSAVFAFGYKTLLKVFLVLLHN